MGCLLFPGTGQAQQAEGRGWAGDAASPSTSLCAYMSTFPKEPPSLIHSLDSDKDPGSEGYQTLQCRLHASCELLPATSINDHHLLNWRLLGGNSAYTDRIKSLPSRGPVLIPRLFSLRRGNLPEQKCEIRGTEFLIQFVQEVERRETFIARGM